MKSVFRFSGPWLFLLLFCGTAWAQMGSLKVTKVQIKHVGPPAVSDDLVKANIRVKPGDLYKTAAVDEDVRSLYGTGFFYNIRVSNEISDGGVVLTYIVQGNPKLTDIKFSGNKKYKDSKLLKKVTSKTGEPLNERKLFTDSQEIQKMYQKAGYPSTQVKYVLNIDENAGRGSVTFEIQESPKIRIIDVQFVGAEAFSQKKLRRQIKTRRHWMFSWITGSGVFKEDQFEDDKETLANFYRDNGYMDFEIKDVRFEYPNPRRMVIRLIIYEGRQYKVGSVKFTGNTIFPTPEIAKGLHQLHQYGERKKIKLGANGLEMDAGDTFTPKGLNQDMKDVSDFYGSRGYIDVAPYSPNLQVARIPNTDTGTIDLEFKINEGQKSYIEKIEIRGNVKTKDKVIRRELAVAPGEVFDMVRVDLSKRRLEGLQYFEKVDTRPESTDVPDRKNLIVGVEEKNTGNLTLGAGVNSDQGLVGFAEVTQGNFDLFHPPTFTGGGQKLRLRTQLGTQQQDYEVSFIEPWFLDKKLALGVDAYYQELDYLSPNNLYNETILGTKISLTKALGSEFLIGSIGYSIEDIGIHLNGDESRGTKIGNVPPPVPGQPTPIPNAIINEEGYSVVSKIIGSIAWDTRNSTELPDRGQRTELITTLAGPFGGAKDYYKLDLKTAWYFKGLAPGHVLEIDGETGVADGYGSSTVPFYDRFYLGGLYSLRGFKYRNVSPREPASATENFSDEPVGGDTYWFGSAEYSIPIIDRLRFAVFYDIGNVMADPYTYNFTDFDANWGLGIRLNLPIGPLRLDYGIPIRHDQFNSGSGQFQFGVGYTRQF